jgi:hypothetical protein
MALVIMRHDSGAALFHWPSCAVGGLDLAVRIDARHRRLIGRVEIQLDDLLNFLGGSFDGLKAFNWLEPVRCPDTPPVGLPIARARLRADAAAGGFSCGVKATARANFAACSGF